jgi:hypothetical protein
MSNDTREDAVHEVERLYGQCPWCGVEANWDPDSDESCEACGEILAIRPFDGIEGDDEAGRLVARTEIQHAILRRIAHGIERLAGAAKDLAERDA